MRKPTPVTTSSITPVSGSTCAVIPASKSPATIHRNNVAVNDSPALTRVNTVQDARKEPASAGTATQCARCPRSRPKTMLTRAPASGNAGISQSVDTAAVYLRRARRAPSARSVSE